jgi:anti-sigma B factor antagonist
MVHLKPLHNGSPSGSSTTTTASSRFTHPTCTPASRFVCQPAPSQHEEDDEIKEVAMLTIDRENDPGSSVVVCRATGEVDSFTVSQFRQALAEVAPSTQVVIDLSKVTFVDSAGLGALVGGIRRTRDLGGDVAVACNRPVLVRLLRSTGFDRIVTIAATTGEAIQAVTHSNGPDRPSSESAPDPDSPPKRAVA